MKKNPYQEAAELEKQITMLQTKLSRRQDSVNLLIKKLQGAAANPRHVPKWQKQLQESEKSFQRIKSQLKSCIQAKRRKEAEGRRLQFGNYKREIVWRDFNRETTQELREQQVLLNSMASSISLHKQTEITEDVSFDLFISHASEDKDDFVRPLAEALSAAGLKVWYDEFSLSLGDSLRKSIDHGLANSRFGLVVLSSAFFAKNWTQYELNGMVSREMEGEKVILPLWHKVTKNEVMRFSPTLVD
ncbi:TIR domain-containing protein [Aeoliella sp. SH292]|uniref:TIR domain-containing protein n=1 Tax=Aeoliella sp. SH292 TaxID=3454464 RepID=UPI003F98F377